MGIPDLVPMQGNQRDGNQIASRDRRAIREREILQRFT